MIPPVPPPKTRVLHVVIGLNIGGAEVLLSDLLPKLNPEKYQITVAVLKHWGVIADQMVLNGIAVIPLRGKGIWSFKVLFRLFKLIRNGGFDIVQSHLFYANLASALVLLFYKKIFPRIRSLRFIVTEHELGRWQKWYHNLSGKLPYTFADKVVCCSRAVESSKKDRFGLAGTRPWNIIYNGISRERWEKIRQSKPEGALKEICTGGEAFIIGTIGRIDLSVKGFDYLIKAVREILGRFPSVLLIGGAGPDLEAIEKLIGQMNLQKSVKLIPSEYSQQMLPLIDLFVLPSIHEGFGLVLLEAMMAGKPVVASNVGGIPEVVMEGETGLLVPPHDTKALVDAIAHLKEHPDESAKLAANGKKRAEMFFSIEKAVAATEALYDDLTQGIR